MSVVDTSHTVLQGKPHPLDPTMRALLQEHSKLNNIHHAVFKASKSMKLTPTLVDAKALKAWAEKKGIYAELKKIASAVNQGQRNARQALPEMELKPPKAHELYGRMDAGTHIVDVGTGDSKRLIRYSDYFEKVTAIDTALQPPKKKFPLNWAREEREVQEREVAPIMSFNVLAQMDDRARAVVEGNDGMHIAPNHEALRSVGRLVGHGPKVQAVMGGGVVFEENELHVEDAVSRGRFYIGVNTYREAEYEIAVGAPVKREIARGKYKRPTYAVPLHDATWKLDGVFHVLKMRAGQGLLRDRTGSGYYVKSNYKGRLELHLEILPDAIFLLRVENYRGMKVFHSVSLLEKFCRRVKFKIGGVEIKSPPRVDDIARPPLWADGVVVRDDDVDYVFNYGVHIDVEAKYLDEVKAYGLASFMEVERGISKVEWVGQKGEITVCAIFEHADGTARVKMSPRYDKKKGDPPDQWPSKFALCKVDDLLRSDQIDDVKDCVCDDDTDDFLV